jgi:hypothetical protein
LKKQTTQHVGHYGVHFNVTTLTILPGDRPTLRELSLCEAGADCWKIVNLIVDTYDRMLAQQLPCEMTVAISRPLTREQADLLNEQRANIGNIIGPIVGAPFKRFGAIAALVVGGAAKGLVHYKLDTHHAADVIVAVYARVSGGIGPQSTSSAFLIKARGGIQ